MPSIKDDSTVEAIAIEFTSNGRNKEKTMREIGYAQASWKSGKQVKAVFGNLRIIKAIKAIDAQSVAKAEITIDNVLSELKKLAMPTEGEHVPNCDRLRSLEMLGKYLSMFSESGNNAATGLNLNFKTKITKPAITKPTLLKIGDSAKTA